MTDRDGRASHGMNDEAPPGADPYTAYDEFNLPAYVGLPTFQKLPYVTDAAALADRRPDIAIVGAPFDDAVSHRSGARFGPRAIRQATYHAGDLNSLQLDIEPLDWLDVVDAGDAPVTPMAIERAHAVINRKVADVAASGAIPIVLGGDHSITFPSAAAISAAVAPRRLGVVHFDAHADAANTHLGPPALARHADAPADRGGPRRRPQLRAGRPARLLAGDRRRSRGCASTGCGATS